uniref:Myb-like domain-containing protein n=1 Tax=Parascaris equorum TaxID=6256 RepID=A0A914RM22_PAREQ
MFVILGISTITHYLMLWGAYIEKYYVLLSKSGKARKKEQRQARKGGVVKVDEAVDASISAQLADERPTLRKLLPLLILSTLYRMALLSPSLLQQSYKYFRAPLEPPEADSVRGEKWSCDELELLVKLTTEKYPSGTPDRWKLVGRILGRSPEDVASMTGKLKLVKRVRISSLSRNSSSLRKSRR